MKNIEVKKIIQAIETSDGAGVKLKRSIGTPEADYIDPFLMLDEFGSSLIPILRSFSDWNKKNGRTISLKLNKNFEESRIR